MKKIAILTVIALSFWHCTMLSRSYKLGNEAAINKDWDKAIEYYERALLEDPDNSVYRLALLRTRISASYVHLNKARELAAQGKKEEALAEYEKSLSYNPGDRYIAEEARSLREEEVKEEKPREIKLEPPIKLKVGREEIQMKFTDAPLRSIFQALGKHAQVNVIFDEQFRDVSFSINLAGMNFEQALDSLCLASKNFFRIIDERAIVIAPDLPAKRLQYELNAIKTFYLSNINAQDIQAALTQILRTQYKAPIIFVDKNLNSVTVKDAPAVVELAEKVLTAWDKPKGEVVIDLEIMEVSRVKLQQLGVDLEQHLVGLRYSESETAETTGWKNLKDLDFSKMENFQITLPTAFLQFLEQDADTKIISQPRLRGIQGEEIAYLVGDRIPIPRTTFTPIAAGGISQQPVTSFQYEDIGIDVKITPQIHFEKEITLELEIKIRSLGGTGYANIPIIATREVKNIIRLKDGETNLLAGLLKDEERKTVRGLPGLKDIPLIGSLFSSTELNISQTDVILTITPYIIRTIPFGEEDLKPLWVGLMEVPSSAAAAPGRPEEELYERRARQRAEQEAMAGRREPSGQNTISLRPNNVVVPQGRTLRMSLNLASQQEIANLSIDLNFDPQILSLKEIIQGGFIRRLGENPPFLKNIDNTSGVCTIGFSSPEIGKGIRGTGSIATLVFDTKGKGECSVSVASVSANGPDGEALSFEGEQSRVIVR
jgi:general secretion pathway protein D